MAGLITPIVNASSPVTEGITGVLEEVRGGLGAMDAELPLFEFGTDMWQTMKKYEVLGLQGKAHRENQYAAQLRAKHGFLDHSRDSKRIMSQTRAAFGASGLAMSGTPVDVLAEQAGELAQEGYRIGLGLDQYAHAHQAKAYETSAKSSLLGGTIASAGKLVLRSKDIRESLERRGKSKPISSSAKSVIWG